ncbi:MAG TPA: RNA polymerase sigma factor [Terriglobales bacterium]|nr:RNA polymerase sigma factor [Terriglobales bacterium]
MVVSDTGKTRIAHIQSAGFVAAGPRASAGGPVGGDDSSLIRQAQLGNAAAFEQLVRQYDRAVLRLAVHLTGSQEDGQDIYQDAFLRAYINLPRFRFECSFYTWIYRIVTNLCLDHLRSKNLRRRNVFAAVSRDGRQEEVLNYVPDQRPGANPEHSLVGRELRQCILRALAKLSPRERVVFELKHYHGLKLRTVAGILNTTEETIKNTLFRATHKLRTELAEIR